MSAHTQCELDFNNPSILYLGGLWETVVRSTKTLLAHVMGCHNPTVEEISAILCQIEAVLNSR